MAHPPSRHLDSSPRAHGHALASSPRSGCGRGGTSTAAPTTAASKRAFAWRQLRVARLAALLMICLTFIAAPLTASDSPVAALLRAPRIGKPASHPAVIAYYLQISPLTVAHLPRLFERVYHPGNVHAIHFDLKISNATIDAAMADIAARVPRFAANTYLLPRQLIVYDGVSMVLATVSAISYLLREAPEWDFFINLSGSDYPLVPSHVTRSLLGLARAQEPIFFSAANQSRWKVEFRRRASNFFFDDVLTHGDSGTDLVRIDAHNPLVDRVHFMPMFAEAWMILPRYFCRYVIDSDTARRMLVTVGHMRGGDEFYFASLAFNHPVYSTAILPNAMRTVVWEYEGVHAGQHPFWLDEAAEDGNGYRFLEFLRNTASFHARKFQHAESPLMDVIDSFADDAVRVAKLQSQFKLKLKRLEERRQGASVRK